MNTTLTINTSEYGSRVLGDWIASRQGAAERAGIVALGENTVESGTLSSSELANLLGAAYRTSSGESVTTDSAMRVSAVYACAGLIAGAIATLD